ncbi:MAG: hypothetical protein E6Q97_32375 [Desulfurellales bacterium]|nr:MAG: hypothetical protein E6Q97_32375 [Desulfurellales bacterium]
MADTTTANYSFVKPEVGASNNTWGSKLNTDLDGIDTQIFNGRSRANHTGTQLAATISDFSTAADARITAAIGSTVQAYNAKLAAIAGSTWAANQIEYQTGTGTIAQTPLTAFARTLIDDADAAAMRTTLGLVIGTNVQAYNANILVSNVEDQGPLTGGARITAKSLGNLSGQTITPDPGDRAIQEIVNNGSGTITPGSNYGQYTLVIANSSGAGSITTTGWSRVGDAFDTTTTSRFVCSCIVTPNVALMSVVKAV